MRHIRSKLKALAKPVSSQGINLVLSKDPSFTLSLTRDASEDDDDSLIGGVSLSLEPSGYYISLLDKDTSITDGNLYVPGDESLRDSTTTAHTSTSKVKQDRQYSPKISMLPSR